MNAQAVEVVLWDMPITPEMTFKELFEPLLARAHWLSLAVVGERLEAFDNIKPRILDTIDNDYYYSLPTRVFKALVEHPEIERIGRFNRLLGTSGEEKLLGWIRSLKMRGTLLTSIAVSLEVKPKRAAAMIEKWWGVDGGNPFVSIVSGHLLAHDKSSEIVKILTRTLALLDTPRGAELVCNLLKNRQTNLYPDLEEAVVTRLLDVGIETPLSRFIAFTPLVEDVRLRAHFSSLEGLGWIKGAGSCPGTGQ